MLGRAQTDGKQQNHKEHITGDAWTGDDKCRFKGFSSNLMERT